jgi:hypothetical protein
MIRFTGSRWFERLLFSKDAEVRAASGHDRLCIRNPEVERELAARHNSAILGRMPKGWKAVRYAIDALLILVPLLGSLYFMFEPAAFNAALAWLLPFH